jgi:serine/threonine-protein kinase
VVRHLQLDAAMAAKFVHASLASSGAARTRFEREARAAAQLSSPHVVQVYDYGVEEGTPYLVMELLRGEDLGARLRRVKRLAPAAVAEILAQAARALRRAHDAGIVHRDLKPGNVFLARNDDAEVVKVLDFGIAKAPRLSPGQEATSPGQLLGSAHYMSPEQVRSMVEVDHRTDLWALAAVAYRCLTGEYPFPGDEAVSVTLSICHDPASPPSRHAPGLSPEIDAFFARALAKDPTARFQTAPELAAAFADAAGVALAASALSQSSLDPVEDGPTTEKDPTFLGARVGLTEVPDEEGSAPEPLPLARSILTVEEVLPRHSASHGLGLPALSTISETGDATDRDAATAEPAPLYCSPSSLGAAGRVRAEPDPTESGTDGTASTGIPPTLAPMPEGAASRARSRLPVALGAVAVLVLAGAGLAWIARTARPDPTVASTSGSTALLATAPAGVETDAGAPRAVEPAAEMGGQRPHDAPSAATAAAPPSPDAGVSLKSPSIMKPPAKVCDPPYVVDPRGHRHIKPQCL